MTTKAQKKAEAEATAKAQAEALAKLNAERDAADKAKANNSPFENDSQRETFIAAGKEAEAKIGFLVSLRAILTAANLIDWNKDKAAQVAILGQGYQAAHIIKYTDKDKRPELRKELDAADSVETQFAIIKREVLSKSEKTRNEHDQALFKSAQSLWTRHCGALGKPKQNRGNAANAGQGKPDDTPTADKTAGGSENAGTMVLPAIKSDATPAQVYALAHKFADRMEDCLKHLKVTGDIGTMFRSYLDAFKLIVPDTLDTKKTDRQVEIEKHAKAKAEAEAIAAAEAEAKKLEEMVQAAKAKAEALKTKTS